MKLDLPGAWVWTRSIQSEDDPDVSIYFARDSRWEPTRADVVTGSQEDMVRHAQQCVAEEQARADAYYDSIHRDREERTRTNRFGKDS